MGGRALLFTTTPLFLYPSGGDSGGKGKTAGENVYIKQAGKLEELSFAQICYRRGRDGSGGKSSPLAVGGFNGSIPPWACRSILEQDA